MILIIEQHGKRQAGTLKGRVLIGRWPDNTIVIDDRAVSRIHAWIGMQDGRYYIADAGSRSGTIVNGEALRERHVLVDGDQIRIGPAVLRYRIDANPPAEAQVIDLTPKSPAELSGEQGVFKDCVCGAPLWLPREFAGIGQCRYCGHTVTQAASPAVEGKSIAPAPKPAASSVPISPPAPKPASPPAPISRAAPKPASLPAPIPAPVRGSPPPVRSKSAGPGRAAAVPMIPPAPSNMQPPMAPSSKLEEERVCGVCHGPITVFDDMTACPSCGLAFHFDCWQENRGCSAYRCAQVGALRDEGSA